MTISAKISAKASLVMQERLAQQLDPDAPTPTADILGDRGVKAVIGGSESPAWRSYMEIFTNDPTELARLIPLPVGSDPDPAREHARAYLVSNGVCTIATTGQLLNNVTKTLDL